MRDVEEAFARALHEAYLRQRLHAGERLGATPSLISWADLPDEFKESSRRNAHDVRAVLGSLGYELRLGGEGGGCAQLTPSEIETLAERLHERWVEERTVGGWRRGDLRDDAARVHPDLVEWRDLPEPRREIERHLGRDLPQLAEEVGLVLVRHGR